MTYLLDTPATSNVRTAHAGYDHVWYISHAMTVHQTERVSLSAQADAVPTFEYGTGIHAAFNIITESCDIRDGRSAYCASKANGDTTLGQFIQRLQAVEHGDIGLTGADVFRDRDYTTLEGEYVVRRAKGETRSTLFVEELERAGALEGAGKNDDWGYEGSQLPQYKRGFSSEPEPSRYTPDDGYSRLPRRERIQRHPKTLALIDTWAE